MPVVLPSPQISPSPFQANIAFQPLAPAAALAFSVLVYRANSLSLFREPGFPAYDASLERYRRKAGSRKRRITKWSVATGVGHRVYSLSRSV